MEPWSVADSSVQICNPFVFSLYLHILCIWFIWCRFIDLSLIQSQSTHHLIALSPHLSLISFQSHYPLISDIAPRALSPPMEASAHPQPTTSSAAARSSPTNAGIAQSRSLMLVQSHHTAQHDLLSYVMYSISIFPSFHTNVYKYYTVMRQDPCIINGRMAGWHAREVWIAVDRCVDGIEWKDERMLVGLARDWLIYWIWWKGWNHETARPWAVQHAFS